MLSSWCCHAEDIMAQGVAVFTSDFLQPGGQDSSLGLIILNRPLPRVTAHLWLRGALVAFEVLGSILLAQDVY